MELTTPTPITHVGEQRGMNYTSAPWLLQQGEWRRLLNIRQTNYLEQFPRFVEFASTGLGTVLGIGVLPVQESNRGSWLVWGSTSLSLLQSDGTTTELDSYSACSTPIMPFRYNDVFFYCHDTKPRWTDGGQSMPIWSGRKGWTKDNESLAIGDGPFAKHPFYTEDDSGTFLFVGDVGSSFTWTTDERYRIYVERPNLFPVGTVVRVTNLQTQDQLTGIVLARTDHYLEVRATNTVSDVPNKGAQYEDKTPRFLVTVDDLRHVPAGRYCFVFFDHLVVAGLVGNRNILAWSDVNDLADFEPRSDNEADTYHCSERQRKDDYVTGITGCQPFGDDYLIFTPSCVYSMSYTGLPRVMHVRPLLPDFGNALPYATASLGHNVVWFDIHHGSFFMLTQEGMVNIGAPIAEWFKDTITQEARYAALTWTSVNRQESEVAWWYCGLGQTEPKMAVVYNYATRSWTTRTSPVGVYSHCMIPERAAMIDEQAGTVDSTSSSIDEQDSTGELGQSVFGATSGTLYFESLSSTPIASLLDHDNPIVETGDELFGNFGQVKELASVHLSVGGTHEGVKVEVSARETLASAVTYTDVGTWTSSLPEVALTFPAVVGRVFRLRFTSLGDVHNFAFHGYETNLSKTGARR